MKTLDLLEGILDRGWTAKTIAKANVEYYRLGEVSKKISRDSFVLAKGSQFYDGKSASFPLLKVSKIETGISPAQDSKLTVIITDLYQKQEDVNKLNTEIYNKYLNQSGNAVGILAIKSEFNGDVYIEDGTNRKFQYNTHDAQGRANSKGFRPFYAIFLGNYPDIADAFSRIKNSRSLPNDSQLVIFSPDHLVADLSYIKSLGDGYKQLPDGIYVRQSFSDGNVVVESVENKVELLEVDKSVAQPVSIPYNLPLKQLDNTLLFDPNDIKIEVIINKVDSIEKKWKPEQKGSALEQAVELSKWQVDQSNNLNFVTTIKPEALSVPGLYTFAFEAIAQDIKAETWWTEWSTDNNFSNDWKTYNLKSFLDSLQRDTSSLIRKRKVVIGRFCYAVQKN
ncbi:MAG TPA: hypothetical protein VK203_10365 [Nostocaceae cyanobacterium]|nr:hypothetical protein [Nostocaceae cyanobacterium]